MKFKKFMLIITVSLSICLIVVTTNILLGSKPIENNVNLTNSKTVTVKKNLKKSKVIKAKTNKSTTYSKGTINAYQEKTLSTTKPITTYITVPKTQPSGTTVDNNQIYFQNFEATWYESGVGTYGYSGRTLISGYSVASNYFPQGTIVKVEGSGLDGIYRVDDRGAMGNNVIDFFYNYGDVPSNFRQMGRVSIKAYRTN